MKKCLIPAAMALTAAFIFTGCGSTESEGLVLRIANCEEYIDEGDWGDDVVDLEDGTTITSEDGLIADFEVWYEETYGTPITVEYSTYGTNEDMYNQLTLGNVFDLVCPSEYMIMKLMDEDKLQPYSDEFFDASIENNYYAMGVSPYIDNVFNELEYNGTYLHQYAAGYMWGTMGLIYNPELVSDEDVSHWSMLLNPTYYKRVTMKDSVRDSYIVSQAIRNEDLLMSDELLQSADYASQLSDIMNDTSVEAVNDAEEILSDMRNNCYSLETDSGKADMVTGKVVANMQWSGDAVYSMQQADEDGVELCYSVPEEATNLWFDGWVMLKSGISEDERKQQAAEAFVNFISRPDNVVRNMYYIGYTSCISGGDDDTIWEFLKWNYEAEDEAEAVDYPLDYFFLGTENAEAGQYVLMADQDQLKRELYAQYPTADVIERAAVMKCFSADAGSRINRMWTNIRCFDFSDMFD